MSILIWSALSISAQVSADAGKELFKANCAACHSKDMRSAATGPALGGSQALWGDDAAPVSYTHLTLPTSDLV